MDLNQEITIEDVQKTVLDIAKKQLPGEEVTISDNIFMLGADSLMAIKIASSLSEEYGIPVKVNVFIKNRALEGVAEYIYSQISNEGFVI